MNLDLPFKDQVTEAMLRGFALRPTRVSATAQKKQGAQQLPASERSTRRSRKNTPQSQPSIEWLLQNLSRLRQQRADIDSQIDKLEAEVRNRIQQQLGAEYVQQLFESIS